MANAPHGLAVVGHGTGVGVTVDTTVAIMHGVVVTVACGEPTSPEPRAKST